MTSKTDLPDRKGPISRQAAFSKASCHVEEALDVVIEIMKDPRMNPNARLGAARTIIDKVLPDLKATEVTGEEGGPIRIDLKEMLEKIYGLPKPPGDMPSDS